MAKDEVMAWLRVLTAGWAGVEERTSFDNPCLRVGKSPFAVVDRYNDADCLFLKVEPELRLALLAKPGWFAAPYDPHARGLCCALENFDPAEVEPLVRASYRLAAPGRIRKTWQD